jgi:hypothetical protein
MNYNYLGASYLLDNFELDHAQENWDCTFGALLLLCGYLDELDIETVIDCMIS